jgi:hypothetical protein
MKSVMRTEGQTILLEGTVLKPTEDDMQRVQRIRDELAERHDAEGGRSSISRRREVDIAD